MSKRNNIKRKKPDPKQKVGEAISKEHYKTDHIDHHTYNFRKKFTEEFERSPTLKKIVKLEIIGVAGIYLILLIFILYNWFCPIKLS